MPPDSATEPLALDELGILGASGDDAAPFLHSQFTNDLHALADDRAQLSAYCMPKGHTVANFLIWRTGAGQYRIVVPRELAAPLLQRLQMFRLRARVELEDLSGLLALHGLLPGAATPVSVDLPPAPLGKAERDACTVIAWPGASRRWLLASPRTSAADAPAGGHGSGSRQWRWLDIEDGLPFVQAANRERFVPQHLNLDLLDAVSFDKGCYPGQEVVARMHYRGKIKHRAYRLSSTPAEALQPGDEVFLRQAADARACGRIIDAQPAPEGDVWHLLASLRVADAEQPLCALRPEGPTLKRLPLPYPLREPDSPCPA